ncbi:MAG: nucleotide sugar dehydrogenase [Proteobacteria bacterium]|nr:MAG: nucleotide sugar dehydrogenase [Pseudomonadota bacterium]
MATNSGGADRVTTVSPDSTIDFTVRRMAEKHGAGKVYGIAVVVDDDARVLGILTDGDVRRAYAKDIDFSLPVSEIMVTDPVVLPRDEEPRNILGHLTRQIASKSRLTTNMVGHVVVVDDAGRLEDVIDVVDLLARSGTMSDNVAVYGLGFIGLPLAVTLSNVGHRVYGVDISARVRADIAAGSLGFHEPGLEDMLSIVVENGMLTIHERITEPNCNVHIVAVGTPVSADGVIDERGVIGAAEHIAEVLKRGDLVQLRSTVPVGCTRQRFIRLLEQRSRLTAGVDFFVAFAPERTVEGEALKELRSLPQIVGGLSARCLEKAATFWSTVTNTIVRVDSLEAAEMVKLANNTFRDLSFAFANELAVLCDKHNLDAFAVVEAANEGYPRDRIPKPSPGVGGYCLTKDPLIYDRSIGDGETQRTLGYHGRAANERAAAYPRKVIEHWSASRESPLTELSVLCIGVAFKGYPETNDIRNSTALSFALWAAGAVLSLRVWDAVVSGEALVPHGLEFAEDIRAALAQADAIMLLNNHPAHKIIGVPRVLNEHRKPRLVFDGWHQLDRTELERIPGMTYATMGYSTRR